MLRYSLVLALGLVFASSASAATWAESFFDELSRDFGTVPRGPMLTHPMRVVNKTSGTIQITNVRVSCGCTAARALQTSLAPGQETAILIQMDTRKFVGPKTVTVFVQFSQANQPRFDEVRLTISSNSREDISILPESLSLGKVKRGDSATGSTTLTFVGNPRWEITSVTSDSNYAQPKVELIKKEGGEVVYKLSATMRSDTPAGKWFTDVWVQTNNPNAPKIRVPLTIEVEAPLTVNPMTVGLGEIKAGKVAERKVIVRGARAFRIVGIEGADKEMSVRDTTNENKTVHVLTVTVQPQSAGELSRVIKVLTDLEGEEAIQFLAVAQVVP
jgi:hypothetical protein